MRIAALNHSSPPSPMIGRCVRTGQPRIGKVALLAPGTRSALALVNGRKHFSTRFVRRLQCLYVCSSRDDGLGTMIKLNHAFLHLRGHSWRGAVPKEQKVNSNVTVVNQRPAWVKRDGTFVRTTDHFETTLSVQLKVHAMSRCGVRIVILGHLTLVYLRAYQAPAGTLLDCPTEDSKCVVGSYPQGIVAGISCFDLQLDFYTLDCMQAQWHQC